LKNNIYIIGHIYITEKNGPSSQSSRHPKKTYIYYRKKWSVKSVIPSEEENRKRAVCRVICQCDEWLRKQNKISSLEYMTINNIWNYSNPDIVFKKAKVYLGKNVNIKLSDKPEKKYMIYNPLKNKWIYFGQLNPPYEDFTKHHDQIRRQRYLKRTENMKGNWRDDPYSPNNLSRNILW
jgi:hypothetical protein